ncbi:uncharacterized protein HD556DRAFT_1439780 [Suillus plorans]|uniref:Myb-like domain-containing protein n=1 Tax=Suillus plorans TaxID=116603 RepID=A0A9P7DP10_9AGAM|nr:uncharacterized protein HD556DRAFT_1439780 [Suillus plorans]KAG1799401.1 hypothetical protein HD556DRAFT_1439780 [Suillus plorans]
MDWIDPHLRKVLYSAVVAVVSICGQFTTVLMATKTSTATPGKPKAQWNVAETNALLAHLLKNISKAGDSRNFKSSIFTLAATALVTANLLTASPPKTNKCCRNKWNLLKGTYREIQNYRNISGAHWDNVKGAGIEREAALEVFNSYIGSSTTHSSLRQFANNGWIFYDKVAEILPHGTGAQGSHAFHPAAAAAPVLVDDDPGPRPGAQNIITAAVATVAASTNLLAATIETPCNTNFTPPIF